jgi:hypothetical protein
MVQTDNPDKWHIDPYDCLVTGALSGWFIRDETEAVVAVVGLRKDGTRNPSADATKIAGLPELEAAATELLRVMDANDVGWWSQCDDVREILERMKGKEN